ncbi:MAG: dihydropteroate synthase [Candidatus Omnitrophica bacterium]|nr:dihydropteroate synthase [Candidatus Omnitrophota bacterium]
MSSNTVNIMPFEVNNEVQARSLMESLGVSSQGIKIMAPKSIYSVFRIEGIKSWEANIIKQHLLSLGADAAIERSALVKDIETGVLVFGSRDQLKRLCQKLKNQPFKLKQVSEGLLSCLDNLDKKVYNLTCRDKSLFIRKPVICGIVNITEDSFSRDGLLNISNRSQSKLNQAVYAKASEMIKYGAQIIDIGGESSRPFSRPLPVKEEMRRVIPAVKFLRKKYKKTIISVDTYKYPIARAAADAGADMINDITALRHSPKIAQIIKSYNLGCVLMHMKGTPSTMQISPKYNDLMSELSDFFKQRLQYCRQQSIALEQICLDPGIGFGKKSEDNYAIINHLYKLKAFGLPIFIGISRKSFIGNLLKLEVNERLVPTIAATVISLTRGANILRVHDVKETAQAVKVAQAIKLN